MLVIDNCFGDGLERANDTVLNQGGCFRCLLVTILAHQIKLETAQVPLATDAVIVLSGSLLNSHIGQVHVGVLKLLNLVRVAMMSETAEARAVQVDR